MTDSIDLTGGFGAFGKAIAKALGWGRDFTKPLTTRSQARAEADAAVILAKGEAEAELIRAAGEEETAAFRIRASHRLQAQWIAEQKNLDAIIQKADRRALPGETVPGNRAFDADWAAAFMGVAKDVSTEEMQDLLAAILAGEFTRTGSFSLRTLAAVKLLSPEDVRSFRALCRYCWRIGHEGYVWAGSINPDDGSGKPYLRSGGNLTEDEQDHLETIGLLKLAPGRIRRYPVDLEYYGTRFRVDEIGGAAIRELDPEGKADTGRSIGGISALTIVGAELLPIAGAVRDEQYLQACLAHFRRSDLEVAEVVPSGVQGG